ncbi:ClpP/crotonase-like domain-containing protein [Irpex lacteus]|nr:ClpP/crotonase-like domain-containing protein [Irpex lacteus]
MTTRAHLSGKFIQVSSPALNVLLVELAKKPLNTFSTDFWEEFGLVFDKISLEPDVRAVILASALPKLFSAGIEFTGLQGISEFSKDGARRGLQTHHHIKRFQHAISAPERCPFPVIVAVHGYTIGLAVEIISACDIRLASEDTKFSIKEAAVGLAADIGSLARVPKIAGNQSLVRELALTARDFSAAEGEKLGLISRVVPGSRNEVIAEALNVAKLIAANSPVAVVGTKRVLLHSRDSTVDENLEYVAAWNASALQTVVRDLLCALLLGCF